MNLIERCRDFATKAHEGQVRKYNGAPYIVHPRRIFSRVTGYACSAMDDRENRRLYMQCAAWLHDVLEDCDVTEQQLLDVSCQEVLDIVKELTNPSKMHPELNRRKRKEMDREHLKVVSWEAKTLKLFDRIDNLSDMADAEDDFVQLYVRESGALVSAIAEDILIDRRLIKEARLWLSHLEGSHLAT